MLDLSKVSTDNEYIAEMRKYPSFKEFETWYTQKLNGILPLPLFLSRPIMLGLGTYLLYFETKNIMIGAGGYFCMLYYIDIPNDIYKEAYKMMQDPLFIDSYEEEKVSHISKFYKIAITNAFYYISNPKIPI